ncbi:nuclease-related domain-containing protein [Bacillus sp. FSL K6-3431]|uniref:nuclease-related domain-containing protein n=1 Tax=Bacillus sp. FSL K6-3431 TaxID=2921500 RepID=UPI0030F69F5D
MKKKTRSFPIGILKLEALLRRLKANPVRRSKIEEELARKYAGYRGEQALDYHVAQIPSKQHLIFQDLRLPLSKEVYFQIDLLLLSQRSFLILEEKNIAGTIFIDQNQMIRTIDEKEDSFPNPIQQVENQQYHFGNLLKNHSKFPLPNNSFVVMTNSSSIIKPNPDYRAVAQKVIRPAAIRQRVSGFYSGHEKELIENKELQKFSRQLIKSHIPSDPDIVGQFQIDKDEIMNGISCEKCCCLTVKKRQRNWKCAKCGHLSKNAHIQALIDYRLLIGSTITNSQCKNFLQLSSVSITSKLLRSLNLPGSGENKNRSYILSLSELQKMIRPL